MTNRFDISGKVAIVTGGTKGLGEALALGFAQADARVALCSRNQADCDATATRVAEQTGAEVLGLACDTGSWDAVPAFVEAVYGRFGRVDILVNNAGVNPAPTPLLDVSERMWDEVQAINVKGPLRLSTLIAPRMAAQGGGSIINVGSLGGHRECPHASFYGASKAALVNLTKTMAAEWGPDGIRVNVVNPGPFWTPLFEFGEGAEPGVKVARCTAATILKRLGDPDEFVGACLYLASDAASFHTGDSIDVGGGMR